MRDQDRQRARRFWAEDEGRRAAEAAMAWRIYCWSVLGLTAAFVAWAVSCG